MNAHALAKKLLEGPDVPVITLEYHQGDFVKNEVEELQVVKGDDAQPAIMLK